MTGTDTTEWTGPHGTAHRIPHASYAATSPAALDSWIINADCWHPLWSQYLLSLVTLADVEGAPPANKRHPDVTHELTVLVLDPEHGPYTAAAWGPDSLRFLTPVNIAEQFTATDDQARRVTQLCVRAVIDGRLTPETGDAPDHIRAWWHARITQSLEHPHHQER